MMMAYGLFVFSLPTAAYQDLRRQTGWRHIATNRVGKRPVRQFLGPGYDSVQLSGTLLPQFTGGQASLDALRLMADEGNAWPLIEGTGYNYGVYVVTALSENKSKQMKDGASQKIDFRLTLERIDESRTDLLGKLDNLALRALMRGVQPLRDLPL